MNRLRPSIIVLIQGWPRQSSGAVTVELVENNGHRTSWLFNCASSSLLRSHTCSLSSSVPSADISGLFHVLLDCTTSTTSSFLSGLSALLLVPSIHPAPPPIHPYPPIDPSIHPSMWVSERT